MLWIIDGNVEKRHLWCVTSITYNTYDDDDDDILALECEMRRLRILIKVIKSDISRNTEKYTHSSQCSRLCVFFDRFKRRRHSMTYFLMLMMILIVISFMLTHFTLLLHILLELHCYVMSNIFLLLSLLYLALTQQFIQ